MKKYLSIITVLVMATVAITSCDGGTGKSNDGKKRMKTIIQVDASEDLIAASDIEITYKGKGGIDITDTITSTYWKVRIYNDSFPTETGVLGYRLLLKPDPKFERNRCKLDLQIKFRDQTTQWALFPFNIDDIASSKVATYLKMKEEVRLKNESEGGSSEFSAHRVILNKGRFEIDDPVPNPVVSQEPSKETEK